MKIGLKYLLFVSLCISLSLPLLFAASNPIRIVTTSSVLASLTQAIIGDEASIYYIASPKRDIHFVSPTPKDVLMTKKADVFIHLGLEAEIWKAPLLDAAGKKKLLISSSASIDASKGVKALEVPRSLSRIGGDIHRQGNSHYWMDPENVLIMIDVITEGLQNQFPKKSNLLEVNAERLKKTLQNKIKDWQSRMEKFKGTTVISYHRAWPYFARSFGFKFVAELESNPGIPPSAKHLRFLEKEAKEKQVQLVVKQPFHESSSPKKIAKIMNIPVVTLIQAVGAVKEAKDYIQMMEYNIGQIETALGG